ncbi:alanine--tRNA ligase, cytoplasmic isoform X2 [Parasteatoda tepidariorum]|uniref:alanine--tRNA ligase, cytoplasmic isoform X2 n=1 Tax=Parasteatoda tepidariorum TaxID=114398 RepID=UPI001C723442|nr:alanine--tRNA ligase, cytoplasmic isoform X2 [Parasteatoda tepidariorum]
MNVFNATRTHYCKFFARRSSTFQIKGEKCNSEKLSSKAIRGLFLDYFIKENNHKFVASSPVFLNNDPSLLFVNAGMNQFRSVLLNKTYPGHPFYGLKKAANSQKCVRLSGKHNDLKDVGIDLYHHTFFEMLGNWSFGDYSKLEACRMAWHLLTSIYGLNPENLYVTYFGGDPVLGVLPDEECKNVWLEIGVDPRHILPFGAKDNFWEMGDKGPCGPCTEIHYDFTGTGFQEVSQKINNDNPDVMEIWNIVFIQYNREQDNVLRTIPSLNIDTGMGFERLTAVLQGVRSNYDTDIFIPIFKAIQSNFKVRPYLGKTGNSDCDGIDTAYRILADHSRMFSIAIADGMFPDSFDAGHVLRKIIRRAAYSANRVMKTKPGALSSLVPYVAESLDFFPEVTKHIEEIKYVVNEEERLFHQTINKGRKARNKMLSTGGLSVLNGQGVWELQKVHGLEENIVQDLAGEVNVTIDWEDYNKVLNEKHQNNQKRKEEKISMFFKIAELLKEYGVTHTNDSFKYNYLTSEHEFGVEGISSSVAAIVKNGELVSSAIEGDECILVADKSNFYSEGGGQISDIGLISNENFLLEVKHVSSFQGYTFHHGTILKGSINQRDNIQMKVDKEHRLCCSQNHTATHLINTALRKILPYTVQRSSYVGPTYLTLGFSAKAKLSPKDLEVVENFVNSAILQKHIVERNEIMFEELLNIPNAVLLRGEEYPDNVSVITVGNIGPECVSVEPCCGTHVHNTFDLSDFVLIPSKSHGGSTKLISAVTGKQADIIRKNYVNFEQEALPLKEKVDSTLSEINMPLNTYLDLLREVRVLLKKVQSSYDIPLLKQEECENLLEDLKLKLYDVVNSSSKTDLKMGLISGTECSSTVAVKLLKSRNLPETDDSFKYNCKNAGVKSISAKLLACFENQESVESIERGFQCQIVLDRTNFYSEEDNQTSDEGHISCNEFTVKIHKAYKVDGFIFHDGFVEDGKVTPNQDVKLIINQDHRLACSQHHSALHLLNSALKKELSYFFPYSAQCGSKDLQLTFTTKGTISDGQLQSIENFVNDCISKDMPVNKGLVPLKSLKEIPNYKTSLVKECKNMVPIVSIGKENSFISVEPCCGTHVSSTAELGRFIILSHKSNKNKEKIIRAVCGKQAEVVKSDGDVYNKTLLELEEYASNCLKTSKVNNLELWDCLQELKSAKVRQEDELPLLLFRSHQDILSELTKRITHVTSDFVQKGFENMKSEMPAILEKFKNKSFIVHMLECRGDGRKILNYAIENSSDKPCIYFIREGNQSVICSCSVPKNLISSTFSALLWINPVASLLEGRARTLFKDPELFYSVVSKRLDRLDDAVSLAEKFVRNNLKGR